MFKTNLHWRSLARYRARLHPRYRAVFTYLGRRVAQGGQRKSNSALCFEKQPKKLFT